MHVILNDGVAPSSKTLDKIINRFPQLNYDWVLVGVGDMIIKGQEKEPASAQSVKKSKDAIFESITEKQINSSFHLNELTNRIDKALVLQAQSTQLIQNQIMQMANTLDDKMVEWDKSAQKSIDKFDLLCRKTPEDVQVF